MPAVPYGRACDACRSVKKKCDAHTPVCSRCARLHLSCVGSGTRRFIFKGPKCRRNASAESAEPQCAPELITALDHHGHLLATSLLQTVRSDYRFSLSHPYGDILGALPARIGASGALDSAIRALVSAHQDVCLGLKVSFKNILEYATAVRELRIALSNPIEATSIHSLAAATLLVICRNLNCSDIQDWRVHTLGAAQIVRARAHLPPKDLLEHQLLMCLRGFAVGHCILFRDMRLNPDRFEQVIGAVAAGDSHSGGIARSLCDVPRLLRRGNELNGRATATWLLQNEIFSAYQALTAARHELRSLIDMSPSMDRQSQLLSLNNYALTLVSCLIYHCILSGPTFAPTPPLDEADMLIQAILYLAEKVQDLSPLGSSFMFFPLSIAWMAAESATTRTVIKNVTRNLQDKHGRSLQFEQVAQRMEDLRCDLRLMSPINTTTLLRDEVIPSDRSTPGCRMLNTLEMQA